MFASLRDGIPTGNIVSFRADLSVEVKKILTLG